MHGMAMVLSIFGISYAAFCIWLTIRIINRREMWAKWTLAWVVGAPVLYVASAGPACWWLAQSPRDRTGRGTMRYAPGIYWPLGHASRDLPQPVRGALQWYIKLGVSNDPVMFGEWTTASSEIF